MSTVAWVLVIWPTAMLLGVLANYLMRRGQDDDVMPPGVTAVFFDTPQGLVALTRVRAGVGRPAPPANGEWEYALWIGSGTERMRV